ncbi:MAG: carboxylating nicotinate-nucleotide diphosphorylase [Flavobacteriales bacterium]|nr:carboxylating nicotinate-nucleotide diphosphorylase [Flavobacteriales bacterium]
MPSHPHMQQLIELAFAEDLGRGLVAVQMQGDHTSASSIPAEVWDSAGFMMKESCVLSGLEVARRVFAFGAPEAEFEELARDGDAVAAGDIVARVKGPGRSLLTCERIALNFMQRMSGIATNTARAVQALEGTKTRVLDTRKTTPGLRAFEKLAVLHGGGVNHRMGLYDAIMIKDNHVDYAGSLRAAVENAAAYIDQHDLGIDLIVEVRDLTEVEEALCCTGIRRLLLDNFSPALTGQAVELIGGRIETESSGGLTPENIRPYAEAGVDFVSLGFITHSARNMDISLLSDKALKSRHA